MAAYKKTLLYSLGVTVLAIIIAVSVPEVGQKVSTLVKSAQQFTHSKNLIQEVREELFSGPLRGGDDAVHARLTLEGVITHTNAERIKEGLAPLIENAQLNAAAQAKLNDMFARQYFEHISPDGHGPGYHADQAQYSYIIVGENLAQGNFKDDAALVAAWMASPGHRANIMHTRFQEIGVAVGEGIYNGKKTWLAVQEFGSPASSCPTIDAGLKTRIDQDKASTTALSEDIQQRHEQLRTMSRSTPQEQQVYNQKVDEYNERVVRYDAQLEKLRIDIERYNTQVRVYNACIKG